MGEELHMRSSAFGNTPKLSQVGFHPEISEVERVGGVTCDNRMRWNHGEVSEPGKRTGGPPAHPGSLQPSKGEEEGEQKPWNVPEAMDEGMSHLERCLGLWTTVRDQREAQLAPQHRRGLGCN